MNAEEAATLLGPVLGYVPTRQQVALAFLDVDQAAMRAEISGRYRWERWDQKSPINGVPAEQVKASRDDFTGGEAYLVYIDDALVFFQPFNPADGTEITKKRLTEVAEAHVAQLVDEVAQDTIVAALAEAITPNAPVDQRVETDGSVLSVVHTQEVSSPTEAPVNMARVILERGRDG